MKKSFLSYATIIMVTLALMCTFAWQAVSGRLTALAQSATPSPLPSPSSEPSPSASPDPSPSDGPTPRNEAAAMTAASAAAVSAPFSDCEANGMLSYEQAVGMVADRRLSIAFEENRGSGRMRSTIQNRTACPIAVSLGIYEMFGPYSPETLSSQRYFSGTPTIRIEGGATAALEAALPDCMAQTDVWYGDVPKVLVNNHVYGEFLAGGHVREGSYCAESVAATVPTPSPETSPIPSPETSPSPSPLAVNAPRNSGSSVSSASPAPVALSGGRHRPVIMQVAAPSSGSSGSSTYSPGLPNAGFAPFRSETANNILPFALPIVFMISVGLFNMYSRRHAST